MAQLQSTSITGSLIVTGGITGSFSGSIAAPGSNTQVLFNNSGVISANSGFVYNGGNVGIGTASPGGKLDITSTTNSNALLIREDTDNSITHNLWIDSSDHGHFWMYADGQDAKVVLSTAGVSYLNGGNVGIGTASPSKKLHVASSGNEGIFMEGTSNGGHWFDFKSANSNLWSMGAQPGQMGWYNRTDSTYKMIITDGGNVGIGTTSPSTKLHVQGTSDTRITLSDTGGASIQLYQQSSDSYILSTNATRIYTGGGERITITSGGNVGIGTTSPAAKLHIDSTSGQFRISGNSNNFNIYSWAGGVNIWGSENIYFGRDAGTNNNFYFQTGNAASTAMYIETSNSRVGINTTAPQKPLEVISNANDFVSVGVNQMSVGQWTGIHFGFRENNTNYRKSAIVFERTDLTAGNAQGKIHILNGPQSGGGSATLSDAKLTIAENGYTGIGTTSPSATLDVRSLASSGATNAPTFRAFGLDTDSYFQVNNNSNNSADITLTRSDSATMFSVNGHSGTTYFAGDVGIGTNSPSYKLDVNGTGRFPIVIVGTSTVNSGNTKIQIASTAAGNKLGFSGGANFITEENLYVWDFTTGASAGISFQYNGVVNATTFVGALSGNATTATNLSTNRTNWSTNGTISAVVGQLAWKNYGNGHTIFDASNSTNPNGGAINNTNPDVAWTSTYPTLMGWNGSSTYGVRVDSARTADSTSAVSGTTNYVAKFTSGTAIGNSVIYESSSNIGIGTTSPGAKLEVNGSFRATTKSFIIDHPTKEGKKLQYGVLEGPEHSVYVRGKLTNTHRIELPDYWHALIDEDSITVNLTAIGRKQELWVEEITDKYIMVGSETAIINCFYTVFAERKDVEKLVTEFDKE